MRKRTPLSIIVAAAAVVFASCQLPQNNDGFLSLGEMTNFFVHVYSAKAKDPYQPNGYAAPASYRAGSTYPSTGYARRPHQVPQPDTPPPWKNDEANAQDSTQDDSLLPQQL